MVTSSTGLPIVGEKTKNSVSDLLVPIGMFPSQMSVACRPVIHCPHTGVHLANVEVHVRQRVDLVRYLVVSTFRKYHWSSNLRTQGGI